MLLHALRCVAGTLTETEVEHCRCTSLLRSLGACCLGSCRALPCPRDMIRRCTRGVRRHESALDNVAWLYVQALADNQALAMVQGQPDADEALSVVPATPTSIPGGTADTNSASRKPSAEPSTGGAGSDSATGDSRHSSGTANPAGSRQEAVAAGASLLDALGVADIMDLLGFGFSWVEQLLARLAGPSVLRLADDLTAQPKPHNRGRAHGLGAPQLSARLRESYAAAALMRARAGAAAGSEVPTVEAGDRFRDGRGTHNATARADCAAAFYYRAAWENSSPQVRAARSRPLFRSTPCPVTNAVG